MSEMSKLNKNMSKWVKVCQKYVKTCVAIQKFDDAILFHSKHVKTWLYCMTKYANLTN